MTQQEKDIIRQVGESLLLNTPQPQLDDFNRIAPLAQATLNMIYHIDVDVSMIRNILMASLRIYQLPASAIVDDDESKNWLVARRECVDFVPKFWMDYKHTVKLSKSAITEIDRTTDIILNNTADPRMDGAWYKAGLVVGHVQSGKTGNYIGLINKALDSGYKIILLLTGMYNDLRSQTQRRVDSGVLGFDTTGRVQGSFGVGNRNAHPAVINMTTANLDGDFGSVQKDIHGLLNGNTPIVLVCKKQKDVLNNILYSFNKYAIQDTDGNRIIRNNPLFMIDDEADSASVNTPTAAQKIKALNGRIRAILALFEKKVYVGYTATPYANIFINPELQGPQGAINVTDRQGNVVATYRVCDDLFPKNFIVNLTAPSNYIGPNKLLGITPSYEDDVEPLPIIEKLNGEFADDQVPAELPDSLKAAIKHFIVATAIRRARGDKGAHSSMLINVNMHTTYMNAVGKLVQPFVYDDCCDAIDSLGDNGNFEADLRNIYDKIAVTNSAICRSYPEFADGKKLEMPTWDNVKKELRHVANKLRGNVRVIHSGDVEAQLNPERLNYAEYENQPREIDNGLYAIAIGGNTLARGITLEGLCVSYFTRNSRTYDTLMQMGRWFGYRDGYIDACRIYVEPETLENFRHIAVATQEMREEFDDMATCGIKPKDYDLKVKCFPGTLEVTSRGKFGNTQIINYSCNGETLQAYEIFTDRNIIDQNSRVVKNLIDRHNVVNKHQRNGEEMPHWFGTCKGYDVCSFISEFKTATTRIQPEIVTDYISKQMNLGNLIDWTIVLFSNRQGTSRIVSTSIGKELNIIPVGRKSPDGIQNGKLSLTNGSVTVLGDESVDLDDTQFAEALSASVAQWQKKTDELKQQGVDVSNRQVPTTPYGTMAKAQRPSRKGLLLIYNVKIDGIDNEDIYTYVLSFPKMNVEVDTSYTYRGHINI